MKKSFIFTTLAVSTFLITGQVAASPNVIEISLLCPDVSGAGSHTLTNFGNHISGYGQELINGEIQPVAPYYTFNFTSGNFPARIINGGYVSTCTDYDPTQSKATCSYESTLGYDPIVVTYYMANMYGGLVKSQTNDTLVISQFIGLKN